MLKEKKMESRKRPTTTTTQSKSGSKWLLPYIYGAAQFWTVCVCVCVGHQSIKQFVMQTEEWEWEWEMEKMRTKMEMEMEKFPE